MRPSHLWLFIILSWLPSDRSSNFLENRQAEDYWEEKFGNNNVGSFFKMIHCKDEAGLLLLEDVTKGSHPMFLLDKTQVLSLKQALAAVKALATFHGVWWAWLIGKKQRLRMAS